jgi:hypothetical protein
MVYNSRPLFDMFNTSSIFLGVRGKLRKGAPAPFSNKSAKYRAKLRAKYDRLEKRQSSD